jgi:menaquinone-dependent protoporphyrinogen oxidase
LPSEVLITYATKYGSTAEVAKAIAKTLEEAGVATDLRDTSSVGDLSAYRAVVFGAPLYNARLLKARRRFLKGNRLALAGMPLAVFALGPLGTGVKERETARRQLDRSLARRPEIRPLSVMIFGGAIDQNRLRFPDMHAPPLKPLFPVTDVRDWQAIEEWATDLVDLLQLKQ